MQFKTHATNDININGTHLQGYIKASYDELVAVFGKPREGDGEKTDAEWELLFEDNSVVTIYNYKDGHAYLGGLGTPVEKITEWHIGGHSKQAVDKVQIAIDLNREMKAESKPQGPGEAEFEQAKDMRQTIRATKGDAYGDVMEVTLLMLKSRDLVMGLLSGLVEAGMVPKQAVNAINEAHTYIATRTITITARHAKVEMSKAGAKELIESCERLMEMEGKGARAIVESLGNDD